jgi:hypothetical protein
VHSAQRSSSSAPLVSHLLMLSTPTLQSMTMTGAAKSSVQSESVSSQITCRAIWRLPPKISPRAIGISLSGGDIGDNLSSACMHSTHCAGACDACCLCKHDELVL